METETPQTIGDLIGELFTAFPVLSTVLAGVLSAHALALFLVNVTPTPKDNGVVSRFYTVIEWVAGIVSPKTKE